MAVSGATLVNFKVKKVCVWVFCHGVGENKIKFYRIQNFFFLIGPPKRRNKKFIYFWDFEHAGNPLNEQLNWYGLNTS
jgi:hypothetical protein